MSIFESVQIRDATGATLKLESNGALPVNVQDQTTSPVILPLVRIQGSTTLAATPAIGDLTVTVTDATGMVVGQHFRIIDVTNDRYYFGAITAVSINTVTLDTPIDFAYGAGAQVTFSDTNMAVDGSVTPVTFKLRTGNPSILSKVDITRLIVVCTTTSAVDLSKFGNLPPLANGIVFRRTDVTTNNIFNAKTNFDLAVMTYDWTVYSATNPSQGIDGFTCKMTFAGQHKMGVALRVPQTSNIEAVVQDNLTGLTELRFILEGHIVQE